MAKKYFTQLIIGAISYLILVVFTKCSISGNYFIRNLSTKSAVIVVHFSPADSSLLSSFQYDDKMHDINSLSASCSSGCLPKSIKAEDVGNDSLKLTLPPNSIIFIGRGNNYQSIPYSGLRNLYIIDGNGKKTEIININNLGSSWPYATKHVQDGYIAYYDIL